MNLHVRGFASTASAFSAAFSRETYSLKRFQLSKKICAPVHRRVQQRERVKPGAVVRLRSFALGILLLIWAPASLADDDHDYLAHVMTQSEWAKLLQLALKGNHRAQTRVGIAYEFGEIAPRDYTEALKWFTRAAEAGEVRESQFCSGGQRVRVGDCVRIEMSKPPVPSFADRCDDRLEPDNYLLAFRYRLPDFLPTATFEGACLLLRPFQHLGHRERIPCCVVQPRDSHLRKFQAAIDRHTEESRGGLEEHRVRV